MWSKAFDGNDTDSNDHIAIDLFWSFCQEARRRIIAWSVGLHHPWTTFTHFLPFSHNLNEVFWVACNSSIQFIRLVIGFSDVATLVRDIRHKILLHFSIMTTLLTCRRAGGLTIRYNSFYNQTIFIIKLLHVSQLVRITCDVAAAKTAATSVNFGWHGGAPNFFQRRQCSRVPAGGGNRIRRLRGLPVA